MIVFCMYSCMFTNIDSGASICNELVAISECVCPGQSAIYQCSVMGGVLTVYEGSAFQCVGNEITLTNNEFGNENQRVGVCNSEQISISGQGVSQESNCFTSQLNIILSEGVSEKTVTCAVDFGLSVTQIASTTIAISTSKNYV